MSLPYVLHDGPASVKSAVTPLSVSFMLEALYPGQTFWESGAV